MSLVKFTVFISGNSLILLLNDSGLCCSIDHILSTPVGYTDDLATCSLTKRKLDRAMEIYSVHAQGGSPPMHVKDPMSMKSTEKLRSHGPISHNTYLTPSEQRDGK